MAAGAGATFTCTFTFTASRKARRGGGDRELSASRQAEGPVGAYASALALAATDLLCVTARVAVGIHARALRRAPMECQRVTPVPGQASRC